MRRLLTLLVAIFSIVTVWAQSATVCGRIFDAETKEGVVGAVIEVTMPRDTLYRRHYITGHGGYFKTPPMKNGRYKMLVTFLGYTDYTREFEVKSMPLDLGDMAMAQSAIEVGVVVKEVVVPRARIEGDTLRYSASQFKVTADAELETLLKKLPGISISNGQIEAQGEKVRQIYVDNKEFFGGNVQQVLQSIPAQAVESIEVYNRMSDAAQITGVDDGDGGKVINIVTRGSMSHSEFGKVHGSLGVGNNRTPEQMTLDEAGKPVSYEMGRYNNTLKPRYSVGGSINIFRGETRMAIMALANNLNKQNLSDEGISMSGSTNRTNASSSFSVNRQNGVTTAQILAFNYSDRWGKRKRARFDGNIFFNHNIADNNFTIDRWYNRPAKVDTIHYDQYSRPDNYTFRFRGRLDWKVAKRQRLQLTPTYSYSNNSSLNEVFDTSLRSGWSESVAEKNRPLYRYYPSYNYGGSYSHNLGLYAQYSYNFLRQGRVLLIVGNISHSAYQNNREYKSYSGDQPVDSLRKYSFSYNDTHNNTTTYRINPTFRERIGRYVTLNVSYNFQYQVRDRTTLNYTTDSDYTLVEKDLKPKSSSIYDGLYYFHEASVGGRYGKGRSWFSLNLRYRNTTLKTIYYGLPGKMLETPEVNKIPYDNCLYNATLNVAVNKEHSLRVAFNSNMRIPNIWQLNDMFNVGDSNYLSVNNQELRPAQEHNGFVRYTNVSSRFGTTFMVMAKAEYIHDYIGTKIVYSPGKIVLPDRVNDKGEWITATYNPIQLSQPVNLDGYWTCEARASLGWPLKHLRSNLNFVVGATYSDIPMELVDAEKITSTGGSIIEKIGEGVDADYRFSVKGDHVLMHNTSAYAQVTLGSNISENVDFTVTWRGTYNYNNSTLDVINNKYFMHYLRANVKAVLPLGFTVTSSLNFTHFIGFTNNFNDNFTLWNISVGKKVLRSLGEVELCVDDIFNQNMSFGRYVRESYSQLRYNTVLGRTFLVRFTYNIRSLGGQERRRKTMDGPYDRLADVQSKLNSILKF